MALTKGSTSFGPDAPKVPDASSGANDADAKAVYGALGNATRMPRMADISDEAKAASTGDGSSSSASPAFIDGGTFKDIGGVKSAGTINLPNS